MSQEVQATHAIPGCSVFVRSDEDMTIEQFVAIVFQLASTNPGAMVDWSLEIKPSGNSSTQS